MNNIAKKVLSIILIILAFFACYILQANFFTWFNIAGVMPNIFIIFVLFIGLYGGENMGIIFGIIFGLFLDAVSSKNIGPNIITLPIIGLLGGMFDKNFSKESRIALILMVIGSTVAVEFIKYIMDIAINKINYEFLNFFRILLIEVVFNALLSVIFYPIIRKLGYKLENTFRNTNIMTKYF